MNPIIKYSPTSLLKLIKCFFFICLFIGSTGTIKAQLKLEERFDIHGYMDMILLSGKAPLIGNIAYINTYRVNLQPQFIISPKLSTTLLLEGADLFSLDESDNIEEPGIIEWAYLTYQYNEHFKLRAGSFAIPFGIYNERFYASPTQLTSILPSSVYFQHTYGSDSTTQTTFLFPRNASGLMLFGDLIQLDKHRLKYYLYYTNELPSTNSIGLGKYLGGRLLFESTTNQALQFGASYNTYVVSNKVVNYTAGVDLKLNIGNFQFGGEFVLPNIGERDTLGMTLYGSYYTGIASYAQIGYTIKDIVTPYVRYDFFDSDTEVSQNYESVIVAGINVAFHPQVVFKIEGYATRFEDSSRISGDILIGTLAVAF